MSTWGVIWAILDKSHEVLRLNGLEFAKTLRFTAFLVFKNKTLQDFGLRKLGLKQTVHDFWLLEALGGSFKPKGSGLLASGGTGGSFKPNST